MLRAFGGGCQVPMGAHAYIKDGRMNLTALVASPDGVQVISHHVQGDATDGERLAAEMAEHLLANGARLVLG